MSHLIQGFTIQQIDKEIERSMGNQFNAEIYKALDAERYYAGSSGNGSYQSFYEDELNDALEYLEKHENINHLSQEIEFIKDCLDNISIDAEPIIIFFG